MVPTPARSGRAQLVAAVAVFLGAVLYVTLAALPATDITDSLRTHGSEPMVDLRDATWNPVREMFAGENPYEPHAAGSAQPFVGYLPHHLLIHIPFGLLPLGAAQVLSIYAASLATVACFALRRSAARRNLPLALLCSGAVLASYPGLQVVTLGQTTFEALLGITLLGRGSAAGRAIGFALATQKPQIGVPVVVVQLVVHGWRSTVRTAVPTIALLAVACIPLSINAGGPVKLARSFVEGLESHQDAPGDTLDPTSTLRIDAAATVARATRVEPPSLLRLPVAALVVGALALAARRRRLRPTSAAALAATLGLVAHPYTAPLLAVLIGQQGEERSRRARIGLTTLVTGLAAATASQFRIGDVELVSVSPSTTAGILGATVLVVAVALLGGDIVTKSDGSGAGRT